MMKKVYFAGSIRGGRADAELYQKIISHIRLYADVLTEHVGAVNVAASEKTMSDTYIYNQDTAWLRECDMVIAECSCPSHGVGYEMAFSEKLKKPVYILYREGSHSISAMLSGNPYFNIYQYKDEGDALKHIDEIFHALT